MMAKKNRKANVRSISGGGAGGLPPHKRPIAKELVQSAVEIEKSGCTIKEHGPVVEKIVALRFKDGHTHTHTTDDGHGPLMREVVKILDEKGALDLPYKEAEYSDEWKHKDRKVILIQDQSPGDILTMTRALEDLKLTYPHWHIDVRSPCMEIFENCPHLTPLSEADPEVEKFSIRYDDINISGWNGLHFADAFINDMERKLGCRIKKTSIRPQLWVSDEEKGWINQVEVQFGWKGPFWLLNAGRKQDNELKQYHRWQEVVDILNWRFRDRVKIVQIGHAAHIHPQLRGTLNLVGQTDTRQLIRLAYHSEGTIGPLSFQFVIAAALEKPAVVLAAGKEGVRWHLYPHIRHIATNGALECCKWDGCWLGGELGECRNQVNGVPRCFEIVKPHVIADACTMYYSGGRLHFPTEEEAKEFQKEV
jgi:ADP-heptose:LPS heptosyltransferase